MSKGGNAQVECRGLRSKYGGDMGICYQCDHCGAVAHVDGVGLFNGIGAWTGSIRSLAKSCGYRRWHNPDKLLCKGCYRIFEDAGQRADAAAEMARKNEFAVCLSPTT